MPGVRVLGAAQAGRTFSGTADAVRAALGAGSGIRLDSAGCDAAGSSPGLVHVAALDTPSSARLAQQRLARLRSDGEYPNRLPALHADGRRVLVLAGNHVYDMDYRELATDHRALRADLTLGVVPVPQSLAHRFGCVQVGDDGLVTDFIEKPAHPVGAREEVSASMGIYLFRRNVLEQFLYEHPDADDFGHDVVPGMMEEGARVAGHYFVDSGRPRHWRDISDVDAYHAAHMDLLHKTFDGRDSWIGPRTVVAGGALDRCVLGREVQVGPNASLSQSILLADVVVEPGASLRKVIVEQGVQVPTHTRIGFDPIEDRRWGTVTPGCVTVVTRSPKTRPATQQRARATKQHT